MIDNEEIVPIESVIPKTLEFKNRKFRFVTITACSNSDGTIDLIYSFDKDLELFNIKTTVEANSEVASISTIFLAAAFAENEIKELFGLKFSNLVVDYGGHFMLTQKAPSSPFGPGVIIERRKS
jgi:Ni,Fe-hydrogenase III component G